MKQIQEELTKLGKEIAEAKTNVARLEGQRQEIVKQMQEEFGVSTIEEADALITKSEVELTALESKITEDFTALKEKFQW